MTEQTFYLSAIAIGLVASVSDLRHRRIPNVLTFGAAAIGVFAHLVDGGIGGGVSSLAGLVAGLALFMPFFLLGGMGAGDVKLLAALGAWLGAGNVFWVAIYTSLIGGVLAIVVSLGSGYLMTALRNVKQLVTFWVLVGPRPMAGLTLDNAKAPRLAFAVPILLGTVVTLWFR